MKLDRSPEAAYAHAKYRGDVAAGYDEKRETNPKWIAEQRIIRGMLFDLPPKTKVLDVPCGTGRLFEFYREFDFTVLGVDINDDMLEQSRAKIRAMDLLNVTLHKGDILKLAMQDGAVDVALNIRLYNWLSPIDVCNALLEMQRIARHRIIFNVRVRNHPRVRGYDLITAALWLHEHDRRGRPWKIIKDETIVENYQMIMLGRV